VHDPKHDSAARRRQVRRRRRDAAWLAAKLPEGSGERTLLSVAYRIARQRGIAPSLLVTVIFQESQFYHGTRWEPFWTELFILTRRFPCKRLRNKSLGLTSIKPRVAQRLAREAGLGSLNQARSAELVARDHSVALELAALELSQLKARGATDAVAFLCYAATVSTREALLQDENAVLANSGAFRHRLRDFYQHSPEARELTVECPSEVDGC